MHAFNVNAQNTNNVPNGQVWTTGAAFNAVAPAPVFGTFLTPFAANSPWNSKPVNPVLGTKVVVMPSEAVPTPFLPQISSDKFSTAVFQASQEDPPMIVYPRNAKNGIGNPDFGAPVSTITIPHWPASVVPAAGEDGHADIVDPVSGKIYSFWRLIKVDGQWRADQYSWSPLNGTGFGDPAHSNQGARAAGVPTIAGLIRKHEINDGEPVYKHALALSLDDASLSPKIAYVYPVTSTDSDWKTNKGTVPDGARLMLPADFQLSAVATPGLRKVVETLKQYGAYVVDKNMNAPYYIYVEQGGTVDIGPWEAVNDWKVDLEKIRLALRPVVSAQKWVDGNGVDTADAQQAPASINMLSMRGPWALQSGGANAVFSSERQTLEFPIPPGKDIIVTQNWPGTGLVNTLWARANPGDRLRFAVTSTNKAKLRMQVSPPGSTAFVVDTGLLGDGEYYDLVWPTGGWYKMTAESGYGVPSSVQATLTKLP